MQLHTFKNQRSTNTTQVETLNNRNQQEKENQSPMDGTNVTKSPLHEPKKSDFEMQELSPEEHELRKTIISYLTPRLFSIIHDIQRTLKMDSTKSSKEKIGSMNTTETTSPALDFIKYTCQIIGLETSLHFESLKLKKVSFFFFFGLGLDVFAMSCFVSSSK
jgi:hypothetical protein